MDTYFTLQLNDIENDTIVLVPSFGIFTEIERAQANVDFLNKHDNAKLYYSIVPVNVIPAEQPTNA